MKDFDIRDIFCSDRLRDIQQDLSPSSRRSQNLSKDNLKRSMNELLSQIVDSLGPQQDLRTLSDSENPDLHILH